MHRSCMHGVNGHTRGMQGRHKMEMVIQGDFLRHSGGHLT